MACLIHKLLLIKDERDTLILFAYNCFLNCSWKTNLRIYSADTIKEIVRIYLPHFWSNISKGSVLILTLLKNGSMLMKTTSICILWFYFPKSKYEWKITPKKVGKTFFSSLGWFSEFLICITNQFFTLA